MAENTWNLQRLSKFCDYGQSSMLLTAVHLDLFGWIGKRRITLQAAADSFGGNATIWEVFLDGLSAMGLLRKRGGRYSRTRFAARHLAGEGRDLLLPAFDSWDAWGVLKHVLTTGNRPKEQIPFASDRLQSVRLLRALHLHAKRIAPHLIARLSLNGSETLLDIGGGLGSYAEAFCRRYRRLRVTLLEHPNIAPLARKFVNDAGMGGRIRVIGSDFTYRPLPRGFDIVFLSNVLHAHGASENLSLLRRSYRSLKPGGQLILRDVLMCRDPSAPSWGAQFSVYLLLHTPRGRCYSLWEIRDWLSQAGFSSIRRPVRSSPLPFDPDSIIIAYKR
jgi:SAM-dependent methyltransferase